MSNDFFRDILQMREGGVCPPCTDWLNEFIQTIKPKLSSYLKLLLFFLFHLQVHHHTEVRYEVWA